jgi:hypothetical protein
VSVGTGSATSASKWPYRTESTSTGCRCQYRAESGVSSVAIGGKRSAGGAGFVDMIGLISCRGMVAGCDGVEKAQRGPCQFTHVLQPRHLTRRGLPNHYCQLQ